MLIPVRARQRTSLSTRATLVTAGLALALAASGATVHAGFGEGATSSACFMADWRQDPPGDLSRQSARPFTTLLEHARGRLRIVAAPSRNGLQALEITIVPSSGDPIVDTQRAELAAPSVLHGPGTEVWLATTTYLPPGFPLPRRNGWGVIAQLFGESGGASTGSPPIALEVTPSGFFALTVRGGDKPDPSSAAPHEVHYALARATQGVWHDFLLHIRLEGDSTGVVEAWHAADGASFPARPAVTDRGPNVLTVDGIPQAVFPEAGYYRSADNRAATVYTTGIALCPSRMSAVRVLNG